jgi:hypothetical protein
MRTRTLPERLAILRAEARDLLAEISDPFETRERRITWFCWGIILGISFVVTVFLIAAWAHR